MVAKRARKDEAKSDDVGVLPVWDLSDLYSSMQAPEVKRDIDSAAETARAFEARYKGQLKTLAEGPQGGTKLAEAIAAYEGDRRDAWPARQFREPHLFRRHVGPRARQVLRRPAGPADDDFDASPLLRA